MRAVIDFFKKNKVAVSLIAAAAAVGITIATMQGCAMSDYFKHDVPTAMQEFNDGDAKVSLTDSQYVLDDYVADVSRNIQRFQANQDRTHRAFVTVKTLVKVGLEEAGSAIPGGTILMGLLFGGAGLMTRKPGTAKEVAKEKEASFNAGQKKAVDQMQGIVDPDAIRQLVKTLRGGSA